MDEVNEDWVRTEQVTVIRLVPETMEHLRQVTGLSEDYLKSMMDNASNWDIQYQFVLPGTVKPEYCSGYLASLGKNPNCSNGGVHEGHYLTLDEITRRTNGV